MRGKAVVVKRKSKTMNFQFAKKMENVKRKS